MAKRPLVPASVADDNIQKIRAFHEMGCESLDTPSKQVSVAEQAVALGINETTLRKARQFARPDTGYSQDRLDELCALIEDHKPFFATSQVCQLVTVPWHLREGLQLSCIENNWSSSDLQLEIRKLAAPRSSGGRRRKVAPDGAEIVLRVVTNSWSRLKRLLEAKHNGKLSLLSQLPYKIQPLIKGIGFRMEQLQVALDAELARLREGN